MESPEQRPRQENRINTVETREGLESIIHILREAAERFSSLDKEAKVLLYERKDSKGYAEKLKERGQLLVDLPNRLAGILTNLDSETKQQVADRVFGFATEAQEWIEKENMFGLGVLLTHMGSEAGEKNDLEKLIESLDSKQPL